MYKNSFFYTEKWLPQKWDSKARGGLAQPCFIDWQIYVKKMSSCAKWYWPLGECKVQKKKQSIWGQYSLTICRLAQTITFIWGDFSMLLQTALQWNVFQTHMLCESCTHILVFTIDYIFLQVFMLFHRVLTSGTQKSGTPERTPKSGSEAGAPLLLSKGMESGAAINFFGSEEFEQFFTFQLKKC